LAHILVAGLGGLGSALAQGWLDSGHQVSAIRRGDEAPAGIDLYPQDLFSDPVQLPPDQVDLLYIIMTPPSRDEAGYRAAYLTAPARLLDALIERQPLPPTIFVSSTAVYGEQGGTPDELQEPRPEAFNGRILLAAEQEVSLRTLSTAVRFSGIYGPGRERLLRQVQAIRQGGKGPSPQWTNRIHSQDCVGLMHQIGEGWLRGEMQWPVVVGTDAMPALNVAVLNWIAQQTGPGIDLAEPDIAPGKRVRSKYIEEGNYRLQYPDYRSGYDGLI
jgi:nucleoside-diphosphate-sugar epimerase